MKGGIGAEGNIQDHEAHDETLLMTKGGTEGGGGTAPTSANRTDEQVDRKKMVIVGVDTPMMGMVRGEILAGHIVIATAIVADDEMMTGTGSTTGQQAVTGANPSLMADAMTTFALGTTITTDETSLSGTVEVTQTGKLSAHGNWPPCSLPLQTWTKTANNASRLWRNKSV